MKNLILLSLFFSISHGLLAQIHYTDLMHNPQVNFYDVCKAAEAHFATIDKDK